MTDRSRPARVAAWLHRRLTYANVVATLALLLATSGAAYAANTVRSTDIVDGAVKSADIATNGVQSVDIKNGGITLVDLAVGTRNQLTAGAVDHLDDLDGLACTVDGAAGTVVVSVDAGTGAVDLTCQPDPIACTPPAPTGMNIVSTTCDTSTGQWVITECQPGTADTNGDSADGCEGTAIEVCNTVDDDGDLQIDEGLAFAVPNGTADCVSGMIVVVDCEIGFEDQNGTVEDGCELAP